MTQVVKHVINDGQENMHATRVLLRCLEFLRSLQLDTILGGSKSAKKGSRSEPDIALQPTKWAKVMCALPAFSPSLTSTVIRVASANVFLILICHQCASPSTTS
jgi:hypothetical protein